MQGIRNLACSSFPFFQQQERLSSSKSDLLEGIRVSLYSDQTDSGEIGYYFSLDSIIAADSSSLFHLWPRPLPPLQTRRSMAACHLQLTMMQTISWVTCDLIQLCFVLALWISWLLLIKLLCSVMVDYCALTLNSSHLRRTFSHSFTFTLLLHLSLEYDLNHLRTSFETLPRSWLFMDSPREGPLCAAHLGICADF